MFIRLHRQTQRGKVYTSVQLCESYRDPERGGAPRNRVVVNLGPLEKLGMDAVRNLGKSCFRAAGETLKECVAPSLVFARDFGHVHAAGGVWDKLKIGHALDRAGIAGSATFPAAELIRMLVVNRLCDPCSKLALLDWLDSVHYGHAEKPEYQHLLRAMDHLIEVKDRAEPLIARRLLKDAGPLDLVFYDITSTYFEGERSLMADDFRRFGYSRDHRDDRRQIVIGMVTTREGIPLCHHVFAGNTVDKTTVADVVRDLKKRFGFSRVLFVGDRGMISNANLGVLLDESLGFIVAHPLRRNATASGVIERLAAHFDRESEEEQFLEEEREGVRFVVAYSKEIADDAKKGRERRILKADARIKEALRKLSHPTGIGRKPTPQGTYDRIRDRLRDRNLLGFYEVTSGGNKVGVKKDRKALAWEEKIDGLLMLETTDLALPAKEVVDRYKEMAEIERGWRSLKSTLLLRPVFHWTERRIRAHVFVCVLALQLERWMRLKLRPVSVPRALSELARIKVGELELDGKKSLVVTRPTDEQKEWLASLGVPPIPSTLPEPARVV